MIGLLCGFYAIWHLFTVFNEMAAFLKRDEPSFLKFFGLSIVTCGIYGIYFQAVKMGPLVQEVQQRAGVPNPQNHGIMFLIPVYNTFLLQEELNKAWSAPG